MLHATVWYEPVGTGAPSERPVWHAYEIAYEYCALVSAPACVHATCNVWPEVRVAAVETVTLSCELVLVRREELPEPRLLKIAGIATASWIMPHAPKMSTAISPNTAMVRKNMSIKGDLFCTGSCVSMARTYHKWSMLVKLIKMMHYTYI